MAGWRRFLDRTQVRDPQPLYWRVLRLRTLRPSGWQRAVLVEGVLLVAVVVVLADLASAWLLLALPITVAAVVKAHDVLAGWLRPPPADPEPERTSYADLPVSPQIRPRPSRRRAN